MKEGAELHTRHTTLHSMLAAWRASVSTIRCLRTLSNRHLCRYSPKMRAARAVFYLSLSKIRA